MAKGFKIAWKIKLPDPEKCTELHRDFLIETGMRCYAASRDAAQKNHTDSLGHKLPAYAKSYAHRRASAGKPALPDFTWSGRAWALTSQNISVFSRRLDKARLRNSFRGSWTMPTGIVGGKTGSSAKAALAAKELRASLGRDLTGAEWFGIKRQFMVTKEASARAKAWHYVSRHPGIYLLGYPSELVRSIMLKWRGMLVDKGNNGPKVVL